MAFASLAAIFRTQKNLDFQGPRLPMALAIDLPASLKSLGPAPARLIVKLASNFSDMLDLYSGGGGETVRTWRSFL